MLKRRLKSFKYAGAGIADLFKHTPNAKIHLAAAILCVFFGIYFSITSLEWCIIIIAISMVIVAEAINTAIEYLTDLVTKDYHELAKKTKDMAAGAVLLAAIGAICIACFIFLPKILTIF